MKAVNNVFLSLLVSVDRQATANHQTRPSQSDSGCGQCSSAEVPSLRGACTHHQLVEGWSESAGERSTCVLAGTRQPSDQEHTGESKHLFVNGMFSFTQFYSPSPLSSAV